MLEQDDKSPSHKILSALRFLNLLHQEINLATNLKDLQDTIVLEKFQEYISILEDEFLSHRN